MRICLALAESRGGIGAHVTSLVPRFAAAGHAVVVACDDDTAEHFGIADLPGLSDLVTRAAARWGAAASADVVHAHGYRAGLDMMSAMPTAARSPLGRLRSAFMPDPDRSAAFVVSWHNAVLSGGPKGAAMRQGQRALARAADLTLGASADLVELASSYGAVAEEGLVAAPRIPDEVRDDRTGVRHRVRAALDLDESDMVVLGLGRLAPQKDYRTFEAVARLVVAERPGTRVLVAGDGDTDIRRELQRSPVVRLLGHRSDAAELLAAADILLVTSRWEARSLVVQEAMLAGTPVVATAVGGIPELIGTEGDRNAPEPAGLSAAVGNVTALADQTIRLIDSPQRRRRLAAIGHRRAAAFPDEDAVAASLLQRYAVLLRSR